MANDLANDLANVLGMPLPPTCLRVMLVMDYILVCTARTAAPRVATGGAAATHRLPTG